MMYRSFFVHTFTIQLCVFVVYYGILQSYNIVHESKAKKTKK